MSTRDTLIAEPGIYPLSEEEYHADPVIEPSLSRSIAALMAHRTARHAHAAHPRLNPRFRRVEKREFDIGRAAHAKLLRQPESLVLVEAVDWRKGEARALRDAAYDEGRIPLLVDQHERVVEMVGACRAQLVADPENADIFDPAHGLPEVTMIWRERVGKTDVWCRQRLDWLAKAYEPRDYKTAHNASPETGSAALFSNGYDFQGAFARRGLRALGLNDSATFKVVVQETEEPYCLSVVGFAEHQLDDAEADVQEAINRWAWCIESDKWPGYPSGTCYVDRPKSHEMRQMDRGIQRESNPNLFRLAREWQAPHERKSS